MRARVAKNRFAPYPKHEGVVYKSPPGPPPEPPTPAVPEPIPVDVGVQPVAPGVLPVAINSRINESSEKRLMIRALTQRKPKTALDKWKAAREASKQEREGVVYFAREGEYNPVLPYDPVPQPAMSSSAFLQRLNNQPITE